MTENSENAGLRLAQQAIGEFSCVFSELEYELGEILKVIFKVQDHEAADAIVSIDFAKKVILVKSAVEYARQANGEELSGAWKKSTLTTLNEILEDVNNKERVPLAHSRLQPQSDGSVLSTRFTPTLKTQPRNRTQEDFKIMCAKMNSLINDVRNIRRDLARFVIHLEGASGNFSFTGSDASSDVVLASAANR